MRQPPKEIERAFNRPLLVDYCNLAETTVAHVFHVDREFLSEFTLHPAAELIHLLLRYISDNVSICLSENESEELVVFCVIWPHTLSNFPVCFALVSRFIVILVCSPTIGVIRLHVNSIEHVLPSASSSSTGSLIKAGNVSVFRLS